MQYGDLSIELKPLKAKDMIEKEFVVIGSPATVCEKLEAMAKRLNVGHLMVALQFGSMPHAQAKKNIELFGARFSRTCRTSGKTSRGEPVAKAVAQAALAATRDGLCLSRSRATRDPRWGRAITASSSRRVTRI